MVTVGVVVFPGSNCEHDVVEALQGLGAEGRLLWHGDRSLGQVDAVVLPGGFAHGDYLRPGAIARFSPVMSAVTEFAASGGPVIGICNGFQVLTEAGLLPGALQKNRGARFLCTPSDVVVASAQSALTCATDVGDVLRLPINHFEGNYTCSPETLAELRAEDRVVLRYVRNPNGSVDDIAGVCSAGRNVVGLMPHPERACDPLLGSADGRRLLQSMLVAATRPAVTIGSSRGAVTLGARPEAADAAEGGPHGFRPRRNGEREPAPPAERARQKLAEQALLAKATTRRLA